ncbi:hypothetical protein WMF39_08475 [Sorangium sp. So ce1504]|uniref:hypothetical protein n=1 Tax=Sorangium sp. So ce1504 TaxID=3133337 RepID=UPI003F611153
MGDRSMTARFVLVAEDELGQRLARDLADRVVAERGVEWLRDLWADEGTLSMHRTFSGFRAGQGWCRWAEVKRLAEERSIRVHGLGMSAERAMARKAVAIAAEIDAASPDEPRIDALFLVHDTDGDEEVRERLRDGARGRGAPPSFRVIVVAPHPESEAWVIAGAAPWLAKGQIQHGEERKRLGFDPVTRPELLSANRATDKRDAKRVCEALLGPHGDAYQAWERCWKETPLETLEQHGAHAGVRAYTQEIEETLLPLLGDPRPRDGR